MKPINGDTHPVIEQDGAAILATGDADLDEGIAAFMSNWEKSDADNKPSEAEEDTDTKKKPAAEPEPETPDEEPDKDAEEPSEEDDAEDEGEEERKFAETDDETYVKVKVGEEEHEVKVKDLTRLFGQEAALTRKSQEVADARKTADADRAKAVASLDVMLKRATARADQFRQIDFLSVAKNLSAEELNELRTQAQAAFEEEKFLKEDLNGYMTAVTQEQAKQAQAEAADCIKQLTDPTSPVYVEGWDQRLYDDLRTFAVDNGMPKEMVNGLRIPAAFKLMHMAMQFAKGQKALTKTVKVKSKKPVKIIKGSKAPEQKPANKQKAEAALAKLRGTGDVDDAAAAFLARAEAASE